MNRKIMLLCPGLYISGVGITQQISSNVISAAGEFSKANNMYLEWTLGEPVIEIASSAKILYTQGFQQPVVKTGGKATKSAVQQDWYRITILPNPVTNKFKTVIEKGTDAQVYLELCDLQGKELIKKTSTGKQDVIEFNIALYAAGMYTLLLRNADGSLYKTYKIIKTR